MYTHCLSSCRRVVCAVNPQSSLFPLQSFTTLRGQSPIRGARKRRHLMTHFGRHLRLRAASGRVCASSKSTMPQQIFHTHTERPFIERWRYPQTDKNRHAHRIALSPHKRRSGHFSASCAIMLSARSMAGYGRCRKYWPRGYLRSTAGIYCVKSLVPTEIKRSSG